MNKIQRIRAAAESRIIALEGFLGIRVPQKKSLQVLARQSSDMPSREAYTHFLSLIGNRPLKNIPILIPDDMYKAFSFIRKQIGSPVLLRLSDCDDTSKTPKIFLLRKDFLFRAQFLLKNIHTKFYKHFENSAWLLLSDGTLPDGEPYSMEALELACSDASKNTVSGFGNTIFSVRTGTNDYQIVNEVALCYLPDVRQWLSSQDLNTHLRVIDLGGHIGSFSLQVNALLAGRCDIHVYEPEPSNFEQIKINITNNHTDNIKPFNRAVSSVPGQSKLYFNPEHSGAHQLGSALSYKTQAIPVDVITLETVFQELDNMPIDILKIDIEGSEYNALFPVPNLVKQCRLIIGEAQKNKDHVPQDIINFLENLDFKVTFSGDPQNCITFSAIRKQAT